MNTIPEYPKMPDDRLGLMSEEKPLSRFIKDEMALKEKLLIEILDQTKLVKKRLDKYEKQIEKDNKDPAVSRNDIMEIKEGLASNKDIIQKQAVESQMLPERNLNVNSAEFQPSMNVSRTYDECPPNMNLSRM